MLRGERVVGVWVPSYEGDRFKVPSESPGAIAADVLGVPGVALGVSITLSRRKKCSR